MGEALAKSCQPCWMLSNHVVHHQQPFGELCPAGLSHDGMLACISLVLDMCVSKLAC